MSKLPHRRAEEAFVLKRLELARRRALDPSAPVGLGWPVVGVPVGLFDAALLTRLGRRAAGVPSVEARLLLAVDLGPCPVLAVVLAEKPDAIGTLGDPLDVGAGRVRQHLWRFVLVLVLMLVIWGGDRQASRR